MLRYLTYLKKKHFVASKCIYNIQVLVLELAFTIHEWKGAMIDRVNKNECI